MLLVIVLGTGVAMVLLRWLSNMMMVMIVQLALRVTLFENGRSFELGEVRLVFVI